MSIIRLDIGKRFVYNDMHYIIKGYASFSEVLAKEIHPPYKEQIIKVSEIVKEPSNSVHIDKELVDLTEAEFNEAKNRYLITSVSDKSWIKNC